MALRFIDSFDHYSTADLLGTGNGQKWNSIGGTTNQISISIGNGRFQNSLRVSYAGNTGGYLIKTLTSQATWVLGVAFKTATVPNQPSDIFSLYDSGTNQVSVRINSTGTLSIVRNGTALTGGTSTLTISTNTWYYIEFLCTIASSISANTCQVNVNGVQWINVTTGQATQNTANATANQIYLGNQSTSQNNGYICDYDDFYICDGSGSANNTFLGDSRVECRYPLAAGANTAWTANGATSVLCVNDATPNGDANYISSSTTNQISTFTVPALSNTPSSIFGIQLSHASRKNDAGPRSIADVVVSGVTTSVGTTVSLGNSYLINTHILETDPNTSSAWGASAANSIEIGVKEIS